MKKFWYLSFIALLVIVLAACSKPGGTKGEETSTDNNQEQTEGNNNDSSDNADGEAEGENEVIVLEPEEGAELIFWGNGEDEGEWIKYVAEEFTKETGIPVTHEEVGHTDAPGKLQTDGPAGLGGDIFMAPHDHVGNMNTAGLIYDNYFAEEYSERFMEGAIQGVSAVSEGELTTYGFPLAIETTALYYNIDLLDEMGFQPAETMEELIEQSNEFMEKHSGSYGFMLPPSDFYFLHGIVAGSGGYVFGDDNTNPEDIGLNNEGAVQAGELMKHIHDQILPLKKEDITGDIISTFFNENKLLYMVNGPWALRGHLDAGVNFGVKTMPKLENGNIPNTFSGVKSLFVNSYSEYPMAATLLAQFATSDEMLLKRYEMTNQLPPALALLESPELQEDAYNLAFLDQAQYSISMPNIPEMQHVWGAMEVAFTAIWNGDAEPKDALDKGVQQIEEAIESQN